MPFPRSLMLLGVLLAFGGCSRVLPSRELELAEMSFRMWVQGRSASRAEAAVLILPTGPTEVFRERVDLTDGDRIVAEVDGRRHELSGPVRLFNGRSGYRAVLPDAVPGSQVRLVFVRSGAPVAIGSGTLPPPFELADLPRAPSASRPLEVRWAPVSSEPMTIAVRGSCLSRTTIRLDEDPGSGVIQAGLLRPPLFNWDGCEVDLTVARAGEGQLERGVHPDSRLVVSQVRTARLEPVR